MTENFPVMKVVEVEAPPMSVVAVSNKGTEIDPSVLEDSKKAPMVIEETPIKAKALPQITPSPEILATIHRPNVEIEEIKPIDQPPPTEQPVKESFPDAVVPPLTLSPEVL